MVAESSDDLINLMRSMGTVRFEPHDQGLHGSTVVVQEELDLMLLSLLIVGNLRQVIEVHLHLLDDRIKQLEEETSEMNVITVLNDVVNGLNDVHIVTLLLHRVSFNH